jgi:pimeloyl-ACP methyl ester carboxylesterase
MLACERHGSGEPLVLIHGVTHRRQAWYPVLDLLTPFREVVLVDLPGHGQSPALRTGGRPVEDVLRTLFEEFLEEQGLVRPHVAGNSLGGRISLEAAVNGHARSVTALSPAGFWTNEASFAYTRQLFVTAMALLDAFGSRAEHLAHSAAGRRLVYGTLMAHPGRVAADHALGDIRGFAYARPALRTLLAAASPFSGEIAPHIPVTIAWAARDLLLPPWQADVAKRLLPQAEHRMMRGVGHVPMWDNPEHVARVLLKGSAPVADVAPLTLVGGRTRRRPAAATA